MRVDGESSTAGVHGFAVFRIVFYRFVFLQRQCSTIVERFGIWNCDGKWIALLILLLESPCCWLVFTHTHLIGEHAL